ncbi:MAG: PAS domain-containing protein, partial [Planctomycetota bacterium]|nr:PAS domain-containing protein [Planctomycetota bacterium]
IRDRVFLEVNAKLAGLLGYAPEELVGQPHRTVWIDEVQEADMAAFWAALRCVIAIDQDIERIYLISRRRADR